MYRLISFALLVASIAHSTIAKAALDSPVDTLTPSDLRQQWNCSTAKDAQDRKQQVERSMLPRVVFVGESQAVDIETRMAQRKIPALSVAVIHHGKLDWSAAWGQLQTGSAKVACNSLFQAGSLAKPVTLFAALRMKQQGLIDFDKNIDSYLSSYRLPAGLQSEQNPVTFRNLFAHTSGITPGGYDGYALGQVLPTDQQTVLAQAPANGKKVEVLNSPNTSVKYSGGGYTVAEIALQDQWHKPFEQIMRTWLLAPLNMKQADFTQPLSAANDSFTARGHQADGSIVPGGWHNHPEQAAAGLWATASDMAAFLIEIRKAYQGKSKIFTQETLREFLAKPIDGHAYGFRLIGEGDQVFITHYGGTAGYRAGMTLNLHSGDGAVYLTNSDNGSELGLEFLAAVARTYHWPVFREVQVKRATQAVAVLLSLEGLYVFADQAWKVRVAYENDALTLVFPNGDRYAMTPVVGAGLEFIHSDTGVRTSFEATGTEVSIQLYGQTGKRQANGNSVSDPNSVFSPPAPVALLSQPPSRP